MGFRVISGDRLLLEERIGTSMPAAILRSGRKKTLWVTPAEAPR